MSKWEMVKLGDVATYVNGYAFKPTDWKTNGLPIVRIQNLNDSEAEYNYFDGEIADRYMINDGDVLISWSASLGVYIWNRGKAVLNQHIFKVVFNKLKIDKGYFKYAIGKILDTMLLQTHGSTMKHITKASFDKMEIPLPPLDVQRYIADTLDKTQEIIDGHKKQHKELDNLIKATFYDMFGDPVLNDKNWKMVSLSEKINVIGGYAFKSNGYTNSGIPVIKIGNINSGVFTDEGISYWNEDSKLTKFIVYPNDMVISLTGTVGKDDYANVCVLPTKYSRYYLNQRNAKLEIKDSINIRYLQYILMNKAIKSRLTGISRGIRQANISNADILELTIPFPPLDLQNKFEEIVTKIEEQKAIVKQSITESQNLFNSLMSKYFD